MTNKSSEKSWTAARELPHPCLDPCTLSLSVAFCPSLSLYITSTTEESHQSISCKTQFSDSAVFVLPDIKPWAEAHRDPVWQRLPFYTLGVSHRSADYITREQCRFKDPSVQSTKTQGPFLIKSACAASKAILTTIWPELHSRHCEIQRPWADQGWCSVTHLKQTQPKHPLQPLIIWGCLCMPVEAWFIAV